MNWESAGEEGAGRVGEGRRKKEDERTELLTEGEVKRQINNIFIQ